MTENSIDRVGISMCHVSNAAQGFVFFLKIAFQFKINTAAFSEVSYFSVSGSDLVSFSGKWPSKDEEMLSWEMLLVVIAKHLLSCISYTDCIYRNFFCRS